MKHLLRAAAIAALLATPFSRLIAASDTADTPPPGGIVISPTNGQINPGDVITVDFPNPMVAAERIDMGGQPWSFVVAPKITGTFLWKSQTEGELSVGTVVAGATHHFTLAPGLHDAAGHPVHVPDWSADMVAPVFSISTDTTSREHLPAQPRIPLSATYDVLLADVATHAWIQDRDSRAHLPVEVIQTTDGPPEANEFQVAPRDPLPPGQTYDLVIEGLQESMSHQPLPYPAVFPLGDTQPLKVAWVGAFNQALDHPIIRVKFNDTIPPDALKDGMVRISPDVPNVEIEANQDEVDINGDFNLSQRYHVTVSRELTGERGYGLAAESRWAATFPPRQPMLAFPGPRIYMRSRKALHFSFLQSYTPAVTWKLASVPLDKLPAVSERLAEYNESAIDPLTGDTIPDPNTGADKQKQTELLIDAFHLPVLVSGTCPAAVKDDDEQRDVTAAVPAGVTLSGPYLVEASSSLKDGRVVGGRALVFFSDYILTQMRSASKVLIRVTRMSDAMPVAGVTVRALRGDSIELQRTVTDEQGMATFSRPTLFPAKQPAVSTFVAYTAGGPCVSFADDSTYEESATDAVGPRPANHAVIITDRNLYRPGEELKMKGILREVTAAGLVIPPAGDAHWQILQGDGDKVIAEGNAPLNDYGAFEGSWTIPKTAALGQCTIHCAREDEKYVGTASIDIEEYRVPLFSVEVSATTEIGTTAHAQVLSTFFHGGSNAAARVHWKAEWSAAAESGSDTTRFNAYPQIGPALNTQNELSQTIEGDTRLDAKGETALTCDAPFKGNPAVGISHVAWHADVTSIDGQTLAGGADETFSSAPVILGVEAEEKAAHRIRVKLEAIDPDGNPVDQPQKVTVDLYHVTTRTVKEQVAPMVFRYRNNDEFAKAGGSDASAPGAIDLSATNTGRYVIAVRAPGTPLVSTEVTVTGEETAEMPVENDTGFNLVTRKDPWEPGDKAVFTTQAPFAGVAWVSVETDEILDTMRIPLNGNAARIEIPVKKEYAPNATVSVYLTQPGGDSGLPVERFTTAPLIVRRPDRELYLAPRLDLATARPGQTIHGEVLATSQGKPVAAADLAVFAVDDAVLQLGGWTLPDLSGTFYANNPYDITNYQSLSNYIDQINPNGTYQKGFVIGDGGEETTPNAGNFRKEFRTLAYWQGSLRTDADGRVKFDFEAPDNLTTYRIVAIGQTRDSQFGGDASQTVKITKPLLIDPALPRFLRNGDEVELRAVVRQSFADTAPVSARCSIDGGCTLEGEATVTSTVGRNVPLVLRFKAKVNDPDLKPLAVRFEATSGTAMSDAVEISVPVCPPTIVRHESIAGTFNGPGFDVAGAMPKDWDDGSGAYSLTLSTSSWLPAIAGIPAILDYPHGCFEQISSKLLCYSLLANLVDYLPDTEARLKDYDAIFRKAVEQVNDNILSDGRLPYWPGDPGGNDFVTCQMYWALNEAAKTGFEIPAGLTDKITPAVKAIATGSGDVTTRAFALFVLASLKSGDDYASTAEDIYLHRAAMDFDGRAFLAMALHQLNVMPEEKSQLMREIDKTIVPTAFKPSTFGSMTRTEGIAAMAFETIQPANFTSAKRDEIRKRLLHILDSGSSLSTQDNTWLVFARNGSRYSFVGTIFSTQENLWLMLAFKSMIAAQPAPPLLAARPAPAETSRNGASAAWPARNLGDSLSLAGLNKSALTFLLHADYRLPQLDTPRVDRGFRVERVVHDLTDPKRAGTPESPWHIGDQLLVTYRILTQKQQYYVALEDAIPAAFETVNPNLAQIGKFFELAPVDPGDSLLDLSHVEIRDTSTLLYFDDVPPGPGVYSILVRATAAGTFRWPATQVSPMYDSRFSGLSASGVCTVTAD